MVAGGPGGGAGVVTGLDAVVADRGVNAPSGQQVPAPVGQTEDLAGVDGIDDSPRPDQSEVAFRRVRGREKGVLQCYSDGTPRRE